MKVFRTALMICVGLACSLGAMAFQTDVFVSGQDGYAAYRIPALAAAPDGTLLAFAEARKFTLGDPGAKGNDIDLVMKRSSDGGRTWSAMQIVEDPGDYWTAGNPSPVVSRSLLPEASSGRIFLHYLRCKPGRGSRTARPGTDDIINLVRHSDDGGKTWSEPVDITREARDMNDKGWKVSVFGPAGAIQDRQGRLIVPVWRADNPWRVFAVFSEDHGKTWQRGEPVPGLAGDESQLVELADGKILIDIRQQKGARRWLAESADGGRTWGPPREGLAATPCCCSILRVPHLENLGNNPESMNDMNSPGGTTQIKSLGEGSGLLLWTGPLGPGRNKLVLRASADDGRSFPFEKIISDEPAAYSSLALLPDGSVGVLWERANYKFLAFTLLTQEFFMPPG